MDTYIVLYITSCVLSSNIIKSIHIELNAVQKFPFSVNLTYKQTIFFIEHPVDMRVDYLLIFS